MEDNKVILTFRKDLSNLAGYDFGLSVFNEQVKDKVNIREDFEIIFPIHITGIASSFVQGFFSEIVGEIGLMKTEEHAKIRASSDALANAIIEKLE